MDKFIFFNRFLKDRRKIRRFGRRVSEQKRLKLFFERKNVCLGHTILDETLCWRKTKDGHSFWEDEYKAIHELEYTKRNA